MNMGRWTTMPAAALAMGLMVLGGCKRGQQAGGAPPQHPPAMVTVAEAALSKVPSYIDEIGKTAAVEYVTIQPQVTGQIQKIHFQDGADLKKGWSGPDEPLASGLQKRFWKFEKTGSELWPWWITSVSGAIDGGTK